MGARTTDPAQWQTSFLPYVSTDQLQKRGESIIDSPQKCT